VAGDFHLIIINLHHEADDFNHMAVLGDLQSGINEGGYQEIETAGWPAD